MDATQVLIRYQDIEGRLNKRGRWIWALEGESITRAVLVLISRGLVEIACDGEPTRASIQLRRDRLNRSNWANPAVVGLRVNHFASLPTG
jgi:hypothetical protein